MKKNKTTTTHFKTRKIALTHADKILYPDAGITKEDLANYYLTVADYILPHIINRPLSIVRCPNGIDEKCFFQKHIHEFQLPDLHLQKIKNHDDELPYIVIKNRKGLLALVQMGVLEIHPWGSKANTPDKPDRIIFDIDPGPRVPWRDVIDSTQLVRKKLENVNLQSYVKTTGGKGLHVVIPLSQRSDWDTVKQFSKAIALVIVEEFPEKHTLTLSKSQRTDKIFIDYLRNDEGATAIAPYSTRARPDAPIATPISWDELKTLKSANGYTLKNLPTHLKHLKKDPWQGFFSVKQAIPKIPNERKS